MTTASTSTPSTPSAPSSASPLASRRRPTSPSSRPDRSRRARKVRHFFGRLPLNIVIVLLLVAVIYPILWLILSSFKTQLEFLNEPFWSLPASWSFDNYTTAFVDGGLGRYILNSVLVVFP